jgi:hypothetical protein
VRVLLSQPPENSGCCLYVLYSRFCFLSNDSAQRESYRVSLPDLVGVAGGRVILSLSEQSRDCWLHILSIPLWLLLLTICFVVVVVVAAAAGLLADCCWVFHS